MKLMETINQLTHSAHWLIRLYVLWFYLYVSMDFYLLEGLGWGVDLWDFCESIEVYGDMGGVEECGNQRLEV